MGANFEFGKKDDLSVNQNVQRVVIVMGAKMEAVNSIPCGNTCALVGIDSALSKSGTVTTLEESHPIANMKYSVSPVVRVAVACKSASDLPKLVEGLRRLGKSDPLVQIIVEPTGEHIVACAGDLHLEITLRDLQDFVGSGVELVVSRPVVPFQETVIASSSIKCLAKSPNNHNRLIGACEPLQKELVDALAIEANSRNWISSWRDDPKLRAMKMVKEFQWDAMDAKKIWAFGPEELPLNVIVDTTKGIQYMNESKDSIVTGFQYVAKKGILAEEPLRGVRFNIMDAVLHSDAIHRGAGQLVPATQRLFSASLLSSQPRLLEPVYLADITCPNNALSGVYRALNNRRGVVVEATPRQGTRLFSVKAYLPVTESFGFASFLREQTSGQAFPQLVFDHFQLVEDDPLEEGSSSNTIAKEIRKRKGIEPSIPPLDRFLDKL